MNKSLFDSKAALTPSAAGATTMVLTGTLSSTFSLPGGITALAISFFLGLCWFLLSEEELPWLQRIVLYPLNSLTIFSVALGLNAAGVQAFMPQTRAVDVAPGFFHTWQLFG